VLGDAAYGTGELLAAVTEGGQSLSDGLCNKILS
jgi:hypothetical protein